MAAQRAAFLGLAVALIAGTPALAEPDVAIDPAESVVQVADARASCLAAFAEPIAGAPCKLAGFGEIGTLDGHSFAYALYAFRTPEGSSMGARAVVFEHLDADRLRILFAPENDGGPFDTPKLIRTQAGILLHIPGFETGTGNFNSERLYIWRKPEWRLVDTTTWLDTLAQKLPKGLGAGKGIYPDYRNMTATTSLWREGDSNAAPTGGSAAIGLGWKGDKIVLKSVQVRR